jgi:hypothetical protein
MSLNRKKVYHLAPMEMEILFVFFAIAPRLRCDKKQKDCNEQREKG